MITSDRRTSRRLSFQFDMSYRRAGPILGQIRSATVQNVSVGGVCFHTMDDSLRPGTIIEVELQVPPRHGVLEGGGRLSGRACVRWAQNAHSRSDGAGSVVGAQFCDRPILREAGPDAVKDLLRRAGHVHGIVEGMPG